MKKTKSAALAGLLAAGLILSAHSTALAHVVVRPSEVVTAGFQTFTVSAPNERDVPFNAIELRLPNGLKHVTPTVKPGWQIDVARENQNEDAAVKTITWRGGSVPGGFREDFGFSAQVPADATELQWKAYQTYEDGTTVAWDLTASQQPKKADGSPDFSASGPFSVTKVVKETEAASAVRRSEQAAANAQRSANRALLVGIAGVGLGLAGIFMITRRRR